MKEYMKERIYEIRGQRVILDSDLSEIYGYTTKAFNQQVKNNIEKFDEDFMFELTDDEVEDLRSNFLTANLNSKSRYNLWFICSIHLRTRQTICFIYILLLPFTIPYPQVPYPVLLLLQPSHTHPCAS